MLQILGTLLLVVGMCNSMPARSVENSYKDHKEISHEHCKGIVGETLSETYRMRQDCENVFRNEYIKWSEQMLADEEFVKTLEVYDVTLNADDKEGKMTDAKEKTLRQKRSANECPVFNREYLETFVRPKDRSISPWKYVINQDANRIPSRIVDSVCLCRGCIDIKTAKEDALNLLSVPLPLTIPVTKNTEMTTVDVHLGCTCQVAVTNGN